MKNQINVDEQNTQQIAKNFASQSVEIPKRSKINYWTISTIVFFLLFLGMTVMYVSSKNTKLESLNVKTSTPGETQKTANERSETTSPTDLFKYIEKIEKSKLLNAQLEAWEVEINTNLLTDTNIKRFRINLFDGYNYEVERYDELMQNLNSTCDSRLCTWIGYITGRSCIVKNTVTGKCSPGETITFTISLNENTIVGSIPAVVGVNKYAYSVGGKTNDHGPTLSKIDTSRLVID